MDYKYATRVLTDYAAQIELGKSQPRLSKERKATTEALNRMAPLVNRILLDLRPDVTPVIAYYVNDHAEELPQVRRILALLQSWAAMVVFDADGTQRLPLPAFLSPGVRDAAGELWDRGQWRLAVGNAAGRVNEITQIRLGRHDVSDSTLMSEAFRPEPPEPGKSRLRCPGKQDSETVRSQQKGAQHFAMGTFQAIRNPAVHWTGNGNPVTAAEDLAALSKIAGWVSHWDVVVYRQPFDDSALESAYLAMRTQPGAQARGAPSAS